MRVLLDENLPHKLRAALADYETATAVFMGFGGYKNGALLRAAEDAKFDVLVTGDLSIEHQQNLTGRRIALVSLFRQELAGYPGSSFGDFRRNRKIDAGVIRARGVRCLSAAAKAVRGRVGHLKGAERILRSRTVCLFRFSSV